MSTNLALVTNFILTEKPEVNSPITIKRTRSEAIEYKTMMEATGSKEARSNSHKRCLHELDQLMNSGLFVLADHSTESGRFSD